MKKKRLIILAVLVLILVAGGFFWYWWDKTELDRIFADSKDYIVQETSAGKFIENKKDGLTFKALKGWRLEKSSDGETYISLYSPDEIEENRFSIKTGCKIIAQVDLQYLTIVEIQEKIEKTQWRETSINNNEIIQLKGYEAVKNTLKEPDPYNLYRISIYIPANDKLYFFGVFSNIQDQERCSTEFDKFLETVSINNN